MNIKITNGQHTGYVSEEVWKNIKYMQFTDGSQLYGSSIYEFNLHIIDDYKMFLFRAEPKWMRCIAAYGIIYCWRPTDEPNQLLKNLL